MQWTDKAAERLICKNVPIDNLHCKSGLPAEILALSCLLIHLPYLEASRATTCFWPKFRVRLGKTIIVVAILAETGADQECRSVFRHCLNAR